MLTQNREKKPLKVLFSTRDSIIPVGGGTGSADYNNVGPEGLSLSGEEKERSSTVAGQEEALYTNPNKVVATLNLEVGSSKRAVSII